MEVDCTTTDTELGFTTTLLPLADLHAETEKRKARAKERLEATWGENWEDELGDLMPPWPAEEFLRGLAVFSEKHVDWAVAKTILQDRINVRNLCFPQFLIMLFLHISLRLRISYRGRIPS